MTPFVDNRHIYLFVYFTIFHIKRGPVACIERRYCFPADFFFKPFTGVACKFAAAFFPFIGKFFAHFYRLKSLIDPTFRIAFRSIKSAPRSIAFSGSAISSSRSLPTCASHIMKIQYLVVLFYANEQIVLPLTFNEKAKWLFDGCLTYTRQKVKTSCFIAFRCCFCSTGQRQ